MKKQLIVTLGALLLSTSVLAANNASTGGGFQGPSLNDNLNTVEDVMNASWLTDGTPVTLIGHLTHSLGDERYVFADDTGKMPVKIDNDEWNGQTITPKLKVKINGEIEKNDSINAVDVDSVQILNN
ncbi:YgiW/YdeI family stress tolerance OB fold protein [Photobacterium nomapromontoriensis]|uniref:YgiW/YdeI family stress tolerance OB fold protein n=1 Tax=Photobacterium nomapromontoriensis TaxID=2910237 RepID=UPI003D11C94B